MTSNNVAEDAKNIPCQDLLAQRPACCGWVRRKTVLQDVGEKIETRLKIGRSVSLVNKIPWKQQYAILHENKLYIYNNETAVRAQKVLTLSNFCKFLPAPGEQSKDVPWPFILRPNGAEQAKTEFFGATSQDELQKWEKAVTPELGEEIVYEEESDDDDYDKLDGTLTPPPGLFTGRTLPPTPAGRQTGGTSRSQRALPPPPVPGGDKETDRSQTLSPTSSEGLRSRKVPAIPGTETEPASPEQPIKKPTPPVAKKRNVDQKPPTKKKPQVPLPGSKPVLPPTKEEDPVEDDLTYEMGIVDAAMWKKTTDEAQEFMKQSGLPEGLYLIRKSTDGGGYTLMVICHGAACKFKIDEDAEHKVKLGSTNFASMEALILHFGETNLPNKTTPLTKAHSHYVPRCPVNASK